VDSTPEEYSDPYKWYIPVEGDYKIVQVNPDPNDIFNPSIYYDIGWGHDIGFDSSFIHGKPVIQDGGHNPLSNKFVNYIRFTLYRDKKTDSLIKMLGPLNYKYITIPYYSSNRSREFFFNQTGFEYVYNNTNLNGTTYILNNKHHLPQLYQANNCVYVIGGVEAMETLYDNDDFNETSLIFIEDVGAFFNDYNKSFPLVIVNNDLIDLTMRYLPKSNLIQASDYGKNSFNHSKYWIKGVSWSDLGRYVLGDYVIETSGNNTIDIPFNIESKDSYDIWVRLGFADYRSNLTIRIDDTEIAKIFPAMDFWSDLKWVNFSRIQLDQGNHTISFENEGGGFNEIDAIAILKPERYSEAYNQIITSLQEYPNEIVYIQNVNRMFSYNFSSGYRSVKFPFEKPFLSSEGTKNVAPGGTAGASTVEESQYTHELGPERAIDGIPWTRWASGIGLPQSFNITWDEPKTIIGVRILFERAVGENYSIQTWNGGDWITQYNMTENESLETLHFFNETVVTDKLRLTFTSAPAYNMISIWELEALQIASKLEKNLDVGKENEYDIKVRCSLGPNYYELFMNINDEVKTLNCYDENSSIKVFDLGSFNLRSSNNTISLWSTGRVDIDYIMLSTKNVTNEVQTNTENVSYTKISPIEYELELTNEQPFILIFSESYHPLWELTINDEKISPTPINYMLNAFYINQTGSNSAKLIFGGQYYQNIGIKISIFAYLIAIIIIILKLSKILDRLKLFSQ
jgi:hypothetical protein